MKNIKISLLATLTLMGLSLFSTITFAATTAEMLALKCSPAMQAMKASSYGIVGAHVDKDCQKPQQQVQQKKVEPKKVVKKTMSMDEIRAYKFLESENSMQTKKKVLIAKTLIEKYDLWAVYSKGGGAGIRAKLKEIGLEYAGGEITDYSKNIHAGNIFVYMGDNFTALEVVKLLKIETKDFIDMNISIQDIFAEKVSSRILRKAYGDMLWERRTGKKIASL